VVPCDHLEKQPPHISALNESCSGAVMENTRDPESSEGTNRARHTPQGCSRLDARCFTDSVTTVIS
jgi:pyrimidine deaminase RibD-like protein